MKIWPLVLVLLAPLTGCVTENDPWLTKSAGGLPMTGAEGGANRSLAPDLASVRLSGIGDRPISVRRLTGESTVTQQVIYPNHTASSGENMLTIETGPAGLDRLRRAPTKAELAQQMHSAFANVPMRIDETLRQNAFGPYGVATGALPGGGACVYAWQAIAEWRDLDGKSGQAASIRLRHCDPHASRESLANLLSTLTRNGGAYGYSAGEASDVSQTVRQDAASPAVAASSTSPVRRSVSASHRVTKQQAAPVADVVGAKPVSIPLPDN